MIYAVSVDIFHDNDANVWVGHAVNEGIISEGDTKEHLIDRLKQIIPDVLEERHGEIKKLTIIINPVTAPELTKLAA